MENQKRFIEIPQDIYNKAGEAVQNYSVNMFTINQENNASPLGSGTFVSINNKYAILTAYHVAYSKSFKMAFKIGFNIKSNQHHFSIENKHLHIVPIAKPISAEQGPDLALIFLPENKVGWIKANRSFWNLSKFKSILDSNPIDIDSGLFILYGSPGEFIYESTKDVQNELLQHFTCYSLANYSTITKRGYFKNFDFCQYRIDYNTISNPPQNFEGVSGGGLWYFKISSDNDKKIISERPILVGVAFYQSEIDSNNIKQITCHAWDSIYINLFDILNKQS